MHIGPRGMPFIGFLPKLEMKDSKGETIKVYQYLTNLTKIYGPVMGLFMGPLQTCVISVNGSEAVKEALNNPDLDGRPDTPLNRGRTGGLGLGKALTTPLPFKEQKR